MMNWLFGSWSARILRKVEQKLDAPLLMVPPGMLTPPIARLITGGPRFQQLLRLRTYLLKRIERNP